MRGLLMPLSALLTTSVNLSEDVPFAEVDRQGLKWGKTSLAPSRVGFLETGVVEGGTRQIGLKEVGKTSSCHSCSYDGLLILRAFTAIKQGNLIARFCSWSQWISQKCAILSQ